MTTLGTYVRVGSLCLLIAVPFLPCVAGPPADPGVPAAARVDADGVQRLEIILDSYSFKPSYIAVQAGKPVEFTLKNVAAITPHNLSIDAPERGVGVDRDVAAGRTETLTFTPTVPGTYTFFCDKKLLFFRSHREKGMEGILEVR